MSADLWDVVLQRLDRIENLLGITGPVPAQEELEKRLDESDFAEWADQP